MPQSAKRCILIAEDDLDDQRLTREAFMDVGISYPIHFVKNGEELIEYLSAGMEDPLLGVPKIILLDLNMPKIDGRQALKKIKGDPRMRSIPVVVLTTSKAENDIDLSYDSGANSLIIKPSSYSGLLDLCRMLNEYWLGTVKLPNLIERKTPTSA